MSIITSGSRFQSAMSSHSTLNVVVAVDTEFQGPHTLTSQVATRATDGTVIVQIYYSPAIPPPPPTLTESRVMQYLSEQLRGRVGMLQLRPFKPLSTLISPTQIIDDLLTPEAVSARFPTLFGFGVTNDSHPGPLNMELVGHTLHVDFGRMFGRDFWRGLLGAGLEPPRAILDTDAKVIGLTAPTGSSYGRGPIVDSYPLPYDRELGIRIVTRDLKAMCGKGSLDSLARTYLGTGKTEILTPSDKEEMERVFFQRTEEAYIYAIIDVILTLLLREAVATVDRQLNDRARFGSKIGHAACW
jgi:hypothetical protein